MKPLRSTPRLTLGLIVSIAVGCGAVPDDPGPRIFPPKGIIRGTVSYEGPRPCSRGGHIVGNAVIFVFDRRNPPPPVGFAAAPVNFADVTGDALFASEPRYTGPDLYCPLQSGFTDTIAASAPFVVAPLDGGSYEIHAFFDYTGDFLPEFTIRNLPERGDVGGGYVDTIDAVQPANAGNPNYLPRFLPVDVGVPSTPSGAAIPDFVIPDQGFVADNVTVTIGAPLSSTRPYFFAQGEQVSFDPAAMALSSAVVQTSSEAASSSTGIEGASETDVDSLPILTIPEDIGVLAPPVNVSLSSSYFFESWFPHLRLEWGVPAGELAAATASPFGMQVTPFGQGMQETGLLVWQNATFDPTTQQYLPADIPEGSVPELWPRVVLTKVSSASSTGAAGPMVVLEGITLLASEDANRPDSLFATAAAAIGGSLFDPGPGQPKVLPQDHLTVVLRPSAILLPFPDGPGDARRSAPHRNERRPRLLELAVRAERNAWPAHRAARPPGEARRSGHGHRDRLPADRAICDQRGLPGWSGVDGAQRGGYVLGHRRGHRLRLPHVCARAAAGPLFSGEPGRRRSRGGPRPDILPSESPAAGLRRESLKWPSC